MDGNSACCLSVGGIQIDEAVARAFLEALEPARLTAALAAAERLESDREAALKHWRLDVEHAAYAASQAERRYQAVDPDNRLVARSLEREWEKCLKALDAARIELALREQARPLKLTQDERERLSTLGLDLSTVWQAPTTTRRDQKELLRTLIEDITLSVDRNRKEARLVLRWKGGEISTLELALPRTRPAPVQTDEETVDLVRRLAKQHSDAVIASIVNMQGRKTARGRQFNADRIKGLRRRQEIPAFPRQTQPDTADEAVPLRQAADMLNVAPTTLFRYLQDGLIEAEQLTSGAPWRVRVSDELKARFASKPAEGYMPMIAAMCRLSLPREEVLQKIKCGELEVLYITGGRNKGIHVKPVNSQPPLFEHAVRTMEAI